MPFELILRLLPPSFFPYTAEWSRKLPNEHQQGAWITYSKRTFTTSENRVLSPFLFKNLARSIVLYIKLHTPYLFCTKMSLECRFWSDFIINHFNDVIKELSISAIFFVLFLWHHTPWIFISWRHRRTHPVSPNYNLWRFESQKEAT